MRTLNRNYMRHDYVTDVLTFDFNRGSKLRSQGLGLVCAEIVICPSAAVMNAKNFQTTLQKEIELYVIHGILHVMGYKDHSPGDIARMRQKEAELIKRLQIG